MLKYIGYRDHRICIVSNEKFESKDLSIMLLPEELNSKSPEDLICNYKIINGGIIDKNEIKKRKDIKIALVSNYGTKCGIGTYSKFLYDELISHVKDYKLFIEDNDIYDVENPKIIEDKIIKCWKRGEDLTNLISKIKEYNPDIILIQHEFGLFPNAREWISMMTQLSRYRIIVTMHSIFHHKDKTIVEACIPEIIVHLNGAKEVLKNEKNISSPVYVIPHGCFPCIDNTKLWNFYKSEHTFIQFGFLFRYKGYENSIKAAALLKNKYPDIFFTGLCSISDFSLIEHNMYYDELLDLVSSLNLQKNVGLVKGYQSESVIDSYLRTNKAAVFPYVSNKEHECFGSSGAAPFTMTKSIPVITSNGHHFKDLPTIKSNSPEEIADNLDKLFTNPEIVNHQINIQNEYLEKNSWANVAEQYLQIFEKNFKD